MVAGHAGAWPGAAGPGRSLRGVRSALFEEAREFGDEFVLFLDCGLHLLLLGFELLGFVLELLILCEQLLDGLVGLGAFFLLGLECFSQILCIGSGLVESGACLLQLGGLGRAARGLHRI